MREESSEDRSAKVNAGKRGRGGCSFRLFKGCDPSKFSGIGDAIATLQLITAMNKVIRISECGPNQAVGFPTQSFEHEAMFWWDTIEQRKTAIEIKAMTWEDLKEMVMRKFCADAEVEKAEMKFLNLKAGNMTLREYTTEFNRMSRLVPDMVNSESKRVKCYLRGLPPNVRTFVRASKPATFDSAVELVEMVYHDLAVDEVVVEEKKEKKWVALAKRPGHMARECTKAGGGGKKDAEQSRPKTRAYMLTQEEAKNIADVVTGATTSFVATLFCKKARMKCCRVPETFMVETASETSVRILRMVKSCKLELEGHEFPATLYVLTLGGFDVMLGMDWLSEFEAQIVCKSRWSRREASFFFLLLALKKIQTLFGFCCDS
ncbi:uncharacterized protein LOC143630980 [Bidens hawaiensis]|uniref:uncharacterized protein LOC143630980 n=1 Tax=Bidens hawaiensis TaxID=980011 RepID=UPI00404ADC4D